MEDYGICDKRIILSFELCIKETANLFSNTQIAPIDKLLGVMRVVTMLKTEINFLNKEN